MKKTTKSILALVGAILLLCTFSFSVFAARYTDYQDNTVDPTFRVRASLQGDVYSGTQIFRRVFATTRFDETATSPTYTWLVLSATIEGTGYANNPSVTDEVYIGDYVTTGDVTMPESWGTFYLYGRHSARVYGSTVSFNPPDTAIQADQPD